MPNLKSRLIIRISKGQTVHGKPETMGSHSVAIEPDHVHLFIRSNPYTEPSDMARLIKGRSSHVLRVAPHYTSQACSDCGTLVKKSLTVRTHICTGCGVVLDRDQNAAVNILAKALERTVGHTGTDEQDSSNASGQTASTACSTRASGKRTG